VRIEALVEAEHDRHRGALESLLELEHGLNVEVDGLFAEHGQTVFD